jgi:uncharacterized protein with FMN-binding domain
VSALLVGCGSTGINGLFTGTGFYAFDDAKYPLTVELTIAESKITGVEITELPTSVTVPDKAFMEPLVTAVLAKQSSEVDVVTGATGTSDAFKAAVKSALDSAGL